MTLASLRKVKQPSQREWKRKYLLVCRYCSMRTAAFMINILLLFKAAQRNFCNFYVSKSPYSQGGQVTFMTVYDLLFLLLISSCSSFFITFLCLSITSAMMSSVALWAGFICDNQDRSPKLLWSASIEGWEAARARQHFLKVIKHSFKWNWYFNMKKINFFVML